MLSNKLQEVFFFDNSNPATLNIDLCSRPTVCRTSGSQLSPPRCLSRETTTQGQSPNSRPSFPLSLSRGYVSYSVYADAKNVKRLCLISKLLFQLDKQQFEETIQTLNNLYAEAEKLGGKSYLEGCLACLTAYTIFLCMETHYEKVKTF